MKMPTKINSYAHAIGWVLDPWSSPLRSWGYTLCREHRRMRRFLFALVMALESTAAAEALAREEDEEIADELGFASRHVVVTYQPWMTDDAVEALHDRYATRTLYTSPYGFSRLAVPAGHTPEELVALLRRAPVIRSAELDRRTWAVGARCVRKWGTATLVRPARPVSSDRPVVAVLDTGIDPDGAGLVPGVLEGGRSFVPGAAPDSDLHGHGTRVAALVASYPARVGLPDRTAGVMPVRVLDDRGRGYASWLAEGIYWAADRGVAVVNLSLGFDHRREAPSPLLQDALKYASFRGVRVVADHVRPGPGNTRRPVVVASCRLGDRQVSPARSRHLSARPSVCTRPASAPAGKPVDETDVERNLREIEASPLQMAPLLAPPATHPGYPFVAPSGGR